MDPQGEPIFALIRQPKLELCTTSQSSDGIFVSTSYTYVRHPHFRMHPDNHVPLSPAQEEALERIERIALPSNLADKVARLRFPILWDAVRTWAPRHEDTQTTLRTHLVAHLREARAHRHVLHLPTVPTNDAPAEGHPLIPQATVVFIDRHPHPGIVLRSDDYTAIGASTPETTITTVIESRTAQHLRLNFSRLTMDSGAR